MVKNLPAVWETWVQSLGREDPLGKGMATHPSILAQRIPCTEEAGRVQSVGSQRAGHTHTHTVRMFKSRLRRQLQKSGLSQVPAPIKPF